MRFLVLLIVLTFPVIDVLATLRFARWTGVPALAWMLASTVAGLIPHSPWSTGFPIFAISRRCSNSVRRCMSPRKSEDVILTEL